MAAATKNKPANFDLTRSEVDNIQKALKDQTFVSLLTDYAKELNDPATKARYEAEIKQFERERGFDVSFVHPRPAYTIKVNEVDSNRKVFINICSEAQIRPPVSETGSQDGQTGLRWSIPYSLSKPRPDVDRNGGACIVYDVIFHPDTLYLASRDARIKGLVHSTAFDALESSFNVCVNRNALRFPKMKFKGMVRPTLIRKPTITAAGSTAKSSLSENSQMSPTGATSVVSTVSPSGSECESSPQPASIPLPTTSSSSSLIADLSSGSGDCMTTPTYTIRYRSVTDLQDHLVRQSASIGHQPGRPRALVIDIDLPLLDSAAGIDLDVQERSLSLMKLTSPRHQLQLILPYPVDEESGSAKFDKSQHCLTVTLPVKPSAANTVASATICGSPVMKAERLSSNDSGIEADEEQHPVVDDQRKNSLDSMEDAVNENGADAQQLKCSAPAASLPCDNVPAAACIDCPDLMNAYRTNQPSDEVKSSLDSVLDTSKVYVFPNFTHSVLNDVMIFTLEVKNVCPESVVHRRAVWSTDNTKLAGVQLAFANIGAGHFPIEHAFYVEFRHDADNNNAGTGSESLRTPEDFVLVDGEDYNSGGIVEVECWDNNVVLQLPYKETLSKFRVGVRPAELREKEYAVEKSDRLELSLNDEDANTGSKKKNKYKQEKHPKLMQQKSEETSMDKEEHNVKGMDIVANKDQHSSGESLDSMVSLSSMSPCERIDLDEVNTSNTTTSITITKDKKTPDVARYQRAQSMEGDASTSGTVPGAATSSKVLRGILKRRKEVILTGTRFRCYSESNVDDLGWANSSDQLSSALSQTTIEEGEEYSITKKSVRFSEKVHQQLYRINSSILAKTAKNKKKAEKKRRAMERRHSEGDSVELTKSSSQQQPSQMTKSMSLDSTATATIVGEGCWSNSNGKQSEPLTGSSAWSCDDSSSHEDSGLASSYEENITVGSTAVVVDGQASVVTVNSNNNNNNNESGLAKVKAKRKTKRRTKTFEMSNDLIFDLDI